MSDESPQSEEELAALFADGGAFATAYAWLSLVVEHGDYPSAWAAMTPTLRLARAQAWLWNNREEFARTRETLDEQADALASVPSRHPEWEAFAETEIRVAREAWPPHRFRDVGTAGRPRPLSPGMELVIFAEMSEVARLQEASRVGERLLIDKPGGVEIPTFALIVVEYTGDRWLVASHNGPDSMPVPGWPPAL